MQLFLSVLKIHITQEAIKFEVEYPEVWFK